MSREKAKDVTRIKNEYFEEHQTDRLLDSKKKGFYEFIKNLNSPHDKSIIQQLNILIQYQIQKNGIHNCAFRKNYLMQICRNG